MRDDPNRGTGRTRNMVISLPEGGCVVVAHDQHGREYIKRMIGDLRGPEFLKTVYLTSLDYVDNLRGFDRPIYVDHYVPEFALESRHLRHKYLILLELIEHQRWRAT